MKDIYLFFRLLIIFLFVISVSLNVKFFLDNEVLKNLVSEQLKISKDKVEQITQDLHLVFRQGEINSSSDLNETKDTQ